MTGEGAPAYEGRTRPSSVGWTRIGITAVCGVILAVLMLQRGSTWAAIAALVVFALLNLYVMHKAALDMMFVLVSSLVATGVFYYGISADTNNKMNIPD